jgi:hypothetical protein
MTFGIAPNAALTMPPSASQLAAETMIAPRRFKTAFIFFSSVRHKEIKEELAQLGRTEKVRT